MPNKNPKAKKLQSGNSFPASSTIRECIFDSIENLSTGCKTQNKILPERIEHLIIAGQQCIESRELERAIHLFSRAINEAPNNNGAQAGLSWALGLRALALVDEKKFENAIADIQTAILHCPDAWELQYNLGNAHLKSDNYLAAVMAYQKVIELNFNSADVQCNLGVAFERLGYFTKALECYQNAIALSSENFSALYNMSLLLLKLGDYANGFKLYESRWQTKEFIHFKRNFNAPKWSGEPSLSSKTILLHSEQGFGDTIQFLRFCLWFDSKDVEVLIQCPAPLIEIARSMNIQAKFFAMDSKLPPYDFHCPLMSLPHALSHKTELKLRQSPYLESSRSEKAKWHDKFKESKQPRIGLILEGKNTHALNHFRNIDPTELIDVMPRGIDYFLIQKELSEKSKKFLAKRSDVTDLSNLLIDFSDTAAVCSSMDLIISVDTAVAHLSGALGCPTILLLHYQSDWRWGLNTRTTHWYPTMELLRVERNHEWKSIYPNLAEKIQLILKDKNYLKMRIINCR
jgi:tetratricopeptide (TPR) repeat protein